MFGNSLTNSSYQAIKDYDSYLLTRSVSFNSKTFAPLQFQTIRSKKVHCTNWCRW